MADEALLAARGLTRFYQTQQILHGIDLSLARGEILGFLGQNGAGKSTTMNILCGVIGAHGGNVKVCGSDLARDPRAAKSHLGYLPERPPLHLDAKVDEFLAYCAELRGIKRPAIHQAVSRVKDDCELNDVGQRLIANLSKGYQQRVGLAQALIHRPAVLVLDEPTSGLDPNQLRSVRSMIERLRDEHAIILSTHILSEVQNLCNRVAILHHGHIAYNERLNKNNNMLRVRFAGAPDVSTWPSFATIDAVEQVDGQWFELRVSDQAAASDELVRHAANAEWGLRELSSDSSRLEQVFMDITCRDLGDT